MSFRVPDTGCTQIAVVVLAAVFLLIAIRQVGRLTFRIWQVMLGGAIVVLVTGQIKPADALAAINPDVMVFLFGMFVIGEALAASGYLECIAHRVFRRAVTPGHLVAVIIISAGFFSALLMNDTLAVIGTPLMIALANRHRLPPKLLLITLAVAITTGSVASPIGNPQNLLVATESGMSSPFVTFAVHLLVPTLVSLAAAFLVLRRFFPAAFDPRPLDHGPPVVCDSRSMRICQSSLGIIIVLICANTALSLAGSPPVVTLPLIALCGAAPVLLFCKDRIGIVRRIDWYTLVFFAAMFVLMESVWQSGFFQSFLDSSAATSVPMILATSIIISQFISNVPFVALYLPVILQTGGGNVQLAALAAGSTIAGNLTVLGAASNVIIIQKAEKQGETITFMEFLKIGVPMTAIQAAVYWLWLGLF